MNQSLTGKTTGIISGGIAKEGPVAYSAEQIASMCTDGGIFNGFTAESCGHCKGKVNVFANRAGWFCACGSYNCQSWSNNQIPHETPDHGPALATIREGIASSRRQTAAA